MKEYLRRGLRTSRLLSIILLAIVSFYCCLKIRQTAQYVSDMWAIHEVEFGLQKCPADCSQPLSYNLYFKVHQSESGKNIELLDVELYYLPQMSAKVVNLSWSVNKPLCQAS